MLHSNLGINELGHLTFAGVDTCDLAAKYGTPLYLMDEDMIRENCRAYVNSMRDYMPKGSRPSYASKACSFKRMYQITKEEGMTVDVVSIGELYTALNADFPAEDIFYHGNDKTDADIEYAIKANVGCIVVDSVDELDAINRIASRLGVTQDILMRLSPGIDPHTQEKISTGKIDCKFGIGIETGQAIEACLYAATLSNVYVKGFHCHVGSQCFEYEPFSDAAEIMLKFIKEYTEKSGKGVEVLDLGGGFGVKYIETDPEIDYAECIKGLAGEIDALCEKLEVTPPSIIMEPGRSIVANAGITIYTVGSVKTIPGYKSFVSIDGGMTDNPRYTLYGAEYTVVVANHADKEPNFVTTLAGRCCESGDLIQENINIYKPQRSDIIAVLCTGAYNYSMASNYNRVPRPPVVMIKDGKDYVAVKRETLEDIIALDL